MKTSIPAFVFKMHWWPSELTVTHRTARAVPASGVGAVRRPSPARGVGSGAPGQPAKAEDPQPENSSQACACHFKASTCHLSARAAVLGKERQVYFLLQKIFIREVALILVSVSSSLPPLLTSLYEDPASALHGVREPGWVSGPAPGTAGSGASVFRVYPGILRTASSPGL